MKHSSCQQQLLVRALAHTAVAGQCARCGHNQWGCTPPPTSCQITEQLVSFVFTLPP